METRKVQTVGNGTYTVSLPKGWAESHDLAAGEIVTVHEHLDGVLALQTGDQSDGEVPATADVDTGDPAVLERALRAAYASGVREVTIHHDGSLTAAHRDVVDRVTRERVGMSVTAESGAATTVQILLDSAEVSVSQSLRQLSFAVCSIHRDAVHALAAPPATSPVDSRHDQVDRLSAMVERSVARGMADLGEVDALGTTRSELFESSRGPQCERWAASTTPRRRSQMLLRHLRTLLRMHGWTRVVRSATTHAKPCPTVSTSSSATRTSQVPGVSSPTSDGFGIVSTTSTTR